MKRRLGIATDVAIPFELEACNESAAQGVDPTPSPLRDLPRKFWKPEEIERLQAFAAEGLTAPAIAARIRRSESSVSHAARHRGIPLGPVQRSDRKKRASLSLGYKRRGWSESDRNELIELTRAGQSPANIAELLHRTEGAVKNFARRSGIPLWQMRQPTTAITRRGSIR